VDRYVEIKQQPTAVESSAPDIVSLFRGAGFRVTGVSDMDAWLRRHAVFVTAVAGALYEQGGDAARLAANPEGVGTFVQAVREGWNALDGQLVHAAPVALRIIFSWVPLPFAISYWRRLLGFERGDLYFAQHARHAPVEMAALAADVRTFLGSIPTPFLDRLYAAIDRAAAAATTSS
jgi:hypothetical protein